MKKMWKTRRKTEAVSPVIATILMVAITVVLAAVLYVMVMGFNTGGSTPTAALSASQTGTGSYTVTVISISSSGVANSTGVTYNIVITPTAGHASNMFCHGANIAAGDYFTITGLTAPGTYTVRLNYVSTGNTMGSTTITVQ